jgi:hypothetical protein
MYLYVGISKWAGQTLMIRLARRHVIIVDAINRRLLVNDTSIF